MNEQARCPVCEAVLTTTETGDFPIHNMGGERCRMSFVMARSEHVLNAVQASAAEHAASLLQQQSLELRLSVARERVKTLRGLLIDIHEQVNTGSAIMKVLSENPEIE